MAARNRNNQQQRGRDVPPGMTQAEYKRQRDEDREFEIDENPLAPYGINATMPFRKKVERLHSSFRMSTEEIAALLEEDEERVENAITELHNEWTRLGQELTEEERTRERGRTIGILEGYLTELEEQYNRFPESSILTAKLKTLEQLNKLRVIDVEKPGDTADTESPMGELSKKIAELPAERLAELRKVLSSK